MPKKENKLKFTEEILSGIIRLAGYLVNIEKIEKMLGLEKGSIEQYAKSSSEFNESGTITARDSFTVMNHADMTYDETPFEVFGVSSWSDCDTVTLPVRGTYIITYDCNLIFPYTEVSGINARDSATLRIVNELNVDIPASYTEVWKEFNDGIRFYPESRPVSKTFTLFNQVPGTKYYLKLYGVLNSGLINIAVTKPGITYLLVR